MQGPNPTEPANYTGSYTRVRKGIVDTEIAMHPGTRRTVETNNNDTTRVSESSSTHTGAGTTTTDITDSTDSTEQEARAF
jgi:hypothetical protein